MKWVMRILHGSVSKNIEKLEICVWVSLDYRGLQGKHEDKDPSLINKKIEEILLLGFVTFMRSMLKQNHPCRTHNATSSI
jgi:hypothetical protein